MTTIFISVAVVWTLVFLFSDTLRASAYRKWGIYLLFVVIAVYGIQRVRYRSPLQPLRVWVQPVLTDIANPLDSDLFEYSLNMSLQAFNRQLASFQTKGMGKRYLEVPSESLLTQIPAGAHSISARYAITSSLSSSGTEYLAVVHGFSLDWKGVVQD